jgi:ABC-type cobalamin/Fe3+-siderophores transport system ATPase subunit
MHLASLSVENYRALRRARVSFDQTTVLIGENDCGKSSLLEALGNLRSSNPLIWLPDGAPLPSAPDRRSRGNFDAIRAANAT